MSHRSEVLSDQQWDTIAPLLPGSVVVVPGAPIVRCLKAFFGSYAPVPVGQIYPTSPSPSTCWPR